MKCFVYGTLRPGRGMRSSADADFKYGTTTGRIYFVASHRGFPVARFEEEGVVHGDVVDFSEDDWKWVVDMEEGAGYELRDVEVTYQDGSTETVPAWQYKHTPRGALITNGNWLHPRTLADDEYNETEWDDDEEE